MITPNLNVYPRLDQLKYLISKNNLENLTCESSLPNIFNYLNIEDKLPSNLTLMEFIELLESNSSNLTRLFYKFSHINKESIGDLIKVFDLPFNIVYLSINYIVESYSLIPIELDSRWTNKA